MASKVVIEKEPKRIKFSLERKQSLYGYIFTLPIILGFAFIYIPVLFSSFRYSIGDISIPKGAKGFVTTGWHLDHYKEALFVEEGFLRTVIESTTSLLVQIPVIIIFAFFIANVLNQDFKGRTVARVIFFIPVVISTGVIAHFDKLSSMVDIYNNQEKMEMGSTSGMANVFNYAQLRRLVMMILQNADLARVVLAAVDGLYDVITSSGVQMLVFLAGLQSISVSMYEVAKVEGATGWEVFWKISFPMISPLILVNFIYTVIDLFLKSDNQAIVYINKYMDQANYYSLASALSWVYTVVVLLFVGIIWLIISKLVIYQD